MMMSAIILNALGYKKYAFSIGLCMVLLTLFANLGLSWDNASCAYREQINYSNNVWNDQALNDFPVLVVLNDTSINYSRTGFDDLQFYSNDGKRLPKELEIWNITGNSYIWVRDNISGPIGDYLTLYYNCTTPTINDYTDVWDKNYYLHVYHFYNNSQDSSFYGQNGTITGATFSGSIIGNGYNFDGNDKIVITSPLLPLGTSDRTITAIGTLSETAGFHPLIAYSTGGTTGKNCNFANNINSLNWYFTATDHLSALALTTNWDYMSATLGVGGGTSIIYVNDLSHTKSDHAGIDSQQTDLDIGHDVPDGGYWVGDLDEVRIENTTRSNKWINATYKTLFNQYLTIGTEENAPLPPDYLQITYYSPDLLDINESCDNVNISIIPVSSLPIINCSIWWNNSDTYTFESPENNTLLSLIYALDNGTYNFSWDCYAGERGVNELYNSTGNYSLNVFCAYPYTAPNYSTSTSCPACYNCVPTRQYCADNQTLYQEIYRSVTVNGQLTVCNETRLIDCPDGCKNNKCNPTTYEAWLSNGALFIGVLIAFIVVVMAGRKAKGLRF